MKNTMFLVFSFAFIIISAVSCDSNSKNEVPVNDTECVAADLEALAIGYQGSDNSSSVKSNIILPLSGSSGSTISWSSDSTSVINNAGIVTRPDNGSGNENVELTATVTKNIASDTKTFLLTVIEKSDMTDLVNINFETGTPASLFESVVTGTGSSLDISPEYKLNGNYSLKFTSGGAVDTYLVKTFTSQNLVYARLYIRLKSGFTLNEGADNVYNGIRFFSIQDSSGNDLVTACINRESTNLFVYGYYYQNPQDGEGSLHEHEFKTYPDGTGDTLGVYIFPETTYCFEIYYSYSTGTGSAGIICDGTSFATVTGLANNECIPGRVRLGAVSVYGDRATAGSVIYFDDLVVSTSPE